MANLGADPALRSLKEVTAVSPKISVSVHLLLAAFAGIVCWRGVSWALGTDLFLTLDEIGNLTRFLTAPYWKVINFFPREIYNDRPTGFALEQLLYTWFGFDYHRQLICFLTIHFANCGMGFLLFRKLGVSVPLSLAGIAVFGGLFTTASTATYIGASFDVLCLFFLLGSMLALLSGKRGTTALSACLFLLALRTKEFAIVAPVLLGILAIFSSPALPARQIAVATIRRLWMHLAIWILFGGIYLSLASQMKSVPASDPYRIHFNAKSMLDSYSYYAALIYGSEDTIPSNLPVVLVLLFAAILLYSLIRRDMPVLFSLAAFALTLLPVTVLNGARSSFYVYAPQMFLILLACLVLERLFKLLSKNETFRWSAALVVALALMWWTGKFRRSPYFNARVDFTLMERRSARKSASEAVALLPAKLQPGSHIYIDSGDQLPWLFVPGPCAYLRLTQKDTSINCVMNQPTEALRTAYVSDHGPKYFLNYKEGGSLTLVDSSSGLN